MFLCPPDRDPIPLITVSSGSARPSVDSHRSREEHSEAPVRPLSGVVLSFLAILVTDCPRLTNSPFLLHFVVLHAPPSVEDGTRPCRTLLQPAHTGSSTLLHGSSPLTLESPHRAEATTSESSPVGLETPPVTDRDDKTFYCDSYHGCRVTKLTLNLLYYTHFVNSVTNRTFVSLNKSVFNDERHQIHTQERWRVQLHSRGHNLPPDHPPKPSTPT